MSKVYFAGPDVFRPNILELVTERRAICQRYGINPLFPADVEPPSDLYDPSKFFFQCNIKMLEECDAVIADLNPFRGPEPDSGTAFEVGYAAALGKPIVAYICTREDLAERTIRMLGLKIAKGQPLMDNDSLKIEDFGHPVNLMLAHSVGTVIVGDFEDAVHRIAFYLKSIKT
jgi:nucleoside 2-deoxyribosyltransferase